MQWPEPILAIRLRRLVALAALVGQFFSTFAFPLPVTHQITKDASRPYPCQQRPCGCATADECWAGDCCCFTLEEKLEWADANGIEAPAHVRPAVEARKSRHAVAKKKCSCSEKKPSTEGAATSSSACRGQHDPRASVGCCAESSSCADKPASVRRSSGDKNKSTCCDESKSTDDRLEIRWVVGIFSQKCRGNGPNGQFQYEPSVPPDMSSVGVPEPDPAGIVVVHFDQATSTTRSPPFPPPRIF